MANKVVVNRGNFNTLVNDNAKLSGASFTGDVSIDGSLNVTGITTTVQNLDISDSLIGLNNGLTSANTNDSGIIIERGDLSNAFMGWDESADKFTLGTTAGTAASTGNLTITTGTLVANLEGNVTGNLTGTADLVNVSDSTADTAFPVVFNDENNDHALLDDSGSFTYNPSTGSLVVNNDVNTRHILGKNYVGISNLDNAAGFGHVDWNLKTNIGFKQTSTGATFLNCPANQSISLQVNNSVRQAVKSNIIEMGYSNTPTKILNTLNTVGAASFDTSVDISGDLTISGDIVDSVTTNAANVFATTTGKTTLGGGAVDIGASGSATTVKGTLGVTEAATFTAGSQSAAVARTATADGTGTGTIAAGTSFVTVTSTDGNHIITLPTPVVGNIIHLMNGATGYELRTSDPSTIAINGGSGANAESAVSADTLVRCICTSSTTWIATQFSTAGDESALEAAAA